MMKSKGRGARGKVLSTGKNYPTIRLSDYAVATLLALVPFHAFLTVWLSTAVGHYTLLRLWPEVVLLLLAIMLLLSGRVTTAWKRLCTMRLAMPMALYIGLALVYFLVTLLRAKVGVKAASYGLLLDTRPIVWFLVVFAATQGRGEWLQTRWQKIVLWPLAVVSFFALLQFFVLPPDWLQHFGYVKDVTVAPIQTINQDTSTIRAQSFLRGPNPLGAYLLLGIGLTWVAVLPRWRKYGLVVLALAALLFSFSRSAWLGVVVTTLAWLAATKVLVWGRQLVFASLAALLVILVASVTLLQTNEGFKNAIFHVNDQSTAQQTSNEDRLTALKSGLSDVAAEPFGRGVGTAGPASMIEDDATPARNSENYFLSIGQELGWLGLGIFIVICYKIALALYEKRDPLSQALFATFAGLTLVNLLSYAWADVTIAYLWWGLAGVALAVPNKERA